MQAEILEVIFPTIPRATLQTVLQMCDDSVELASVWILENDWREIANQVGGEQDDEQQETDQQDQDGATRTPRVVDSDAIDVQRELAYLYRGRIGSADDDRDEDEEENEEEDNDQGVDEEDEDNDDDNSNGDQEENDDDNGAEEDEEDEDYEEEVDGQYYRFTQSSDFLFLYPRRKVRNLVEPTPKGEMEKDPNAKRFWVRFDDQVMLKTHLELINIPLKSRAHESVALLNANANFIDEYEAMERLTRFSKVRPSVEAKLTKRFEKKALSPKPKRQRLSSFETDRLTDDEDSNGSDNSKVFNKVEVVRETKQDHISKHKSDGVAESEWGYWAHVFDVDDIDEIWRSMVSGHVFGQRQFGDVFEIRICHNPTSNNNNSSNNNYNAIEPKAFDMLGVMPKLRRTKSVCLIVPCPHEESTMKAVGSAISKCLLLKEPIYYRHRTIKEKAHFLTDTSSTSSSSDLEHSRKNKPESIVDSAAYAFFEVWNKDEHILASQYKLDASKPRTMPESVPKHDDAQIPRHNWGSFRLRPPIYQHQDNPFQLYKLGGVCWKPIL